MLRRNRLALLLGAVLVLGLLAAGCGGGGNGNGGSDTGGGTGGEIVVEAKSGFAFSPNQISAKVGQPVTIVLKNTDTMAHDLTIDNIKVTVDGQEATGVKTDLVQGGGEARITFTPQEEGTYEFYCSVSGHKAAGMVGTLVVGK